MAAGATAVAAAVGGGLWWRLWWWRRQAPEGQLRRTVMVALTVGVVCRLAFLLFNPTFNAPDEQAHFNYVKYLYEERALPVAQYDVGHPSHDYEFYAPPLYYLASVPAYAAAHLLAPDDVDVAVRAIRLFSMALWATTLVVAVLVLRALAIDDEVVLTVALLALLVWPTHVFISASINTDSLLILIGTIVFLLALRLRSMGVGNVVLLGVIAALGMFTKFFAFALVLAVLGIVVARRKELGASLHRCLVFAVGVGAVALVLYLPWLARNLAVYGSLAGGAADVLRPPPMTAVGRFAFGIQQLLTSFWATSGISSETYLGGAVGKVLNGLLALTGAAIAMMGLVKLRSRSTGTLPAYLRQLVLPGLVAALPLLVLMLWASALYGPGLSQGRYLFVVFLPLGLLAGFIVRTAGRPLATHAAGFSIAYTLAFTAYSLATAQGFST